MKDLFFKVPSRGELIQFLHDNNYELPEETPVQFVVTFQDAFVIDYMANIPKVIDEEGNVLEWSTNARFNIRLIDVALEHKFLSYEAFTDVYPDTPYRTFGPLEV